MADEVSGERGAEMPPAPVLDAQTVLLVVDVQNGFCTGGRLAVPEGEAVVPVINRLARRFENVVLTQDWHPRGHASFATSHPGRAAFETVELDYGPQVLWPEHCVQDTPDAELHPQLDVPHAQLIVRKGFHPSVDSYSAFREADRRTPTGLHGYLTERAIRRVVVAGLATDFCVAWTALDARRLGYDTCVVEDACRAIDLEGSLAAAWQRMAEAGVARLRADAFG
jgi:nicotinamidase/pyrazinamidase